MPRYLATGVVSGRTKREVRNSRLPDQETLEHIDRIHPDKLNNFYQVVSVVCANIPGDAEDEARGVSTDEESLAALLPPPSVAPVPVGKLLPQQQQQTTTYLPPIDAEALDRFARTARVSMDAYEKEREQSRLIKADEAAQPADVEVRGLSDQLCQAGHGEAYNAEGPLGQGPGELQPIVGCPPAEFTTSAAAALIKHQIYPVV